MEMLTRNQYHFAEVPVRPRSEIKNVVSEFIDECTVIKEGAFESLVAKATAEPELSNSLDVYRNEVRENDAKQLALVRAQLDGRPMAGKPAVNFLM